MIEKYLVNKCDRVYGTQWELKSLRDWIMVALELNEKYTKTIPATEMYILVYAESNIEASLGKPWSEVRAELEGMEG